MITGIIYKIYNLKDTSQFYVGSTVNFSRRKSHHKKNVTNKRSKRYWTKLYFYIRNNGGWDNFGMEQIIKKEFNSLNELHIFEQTYITDLNPTLNSISAYSHPLNIDDSIKYEPTTEDKEVDDHWLLTCYKDPTEPQNPNDLIQEEPILFIIDLD